MSSCDAWLQFVTPSDVRALKTRLDPFVTALDGAVAQCPKADPGTREAWAAFARSWRAYVASEDHFLTAGAEFSNGLRVTSSRSLDGSGRLARSPAAYPAPRSPSRAPPGATPRRRAQCEPSPSPRASSPSH